MSNEQKIQNEFLEFYEMFKQYKSQNQSTQILLFDVDSFYNSTINRSINAKSRKYTKEQIRRFLGKIEQFERQIREVSMYLYATSQEYKNLINYFSKMLTHDYILIPDVVDVDNKNFLKNFHKTLNYIENYNIKNKLSEIEPVLLREDVFFAYERTDGDYVIWQQLPTNYCRISGIDRYNTYTFEFNFSYFDKQNVDIENYDDEFKKGYQKYKKDYRNKKWQKLNPEKAICFKMDRSLILNLSLFSGIFEGLLGLEDYKDLQENSTRGNNYKLIHQRIPMKSDKDAKVNSFLIDDKAAVKFHNNVKSNIPEYIGVVTTPMELTGITLNSNKFDEDLVGKAEKNLFISAGVSQLLFNSDQAGNIGLNRSIEMDSSIMFSLLRQYEVFFKKKLDQFSSRKYKWKLIFPDITIYNREDMFDKFLRAGQYGFPKFLIAASLGISQLEMIGMSNLENQLGIVDDLIPLISAHTQSGDSGRPKKDENNLADGGLDQRNRQSNDNRAQ